jgi:cell division protease FtsH
VGTVHDEREQTLNALLVELDGFEPNAGVIILAASNRPEVLDRALLRPGRFDRQVVVDSPDLDGREAILKVHSRNKPLAADVVLRRIAAATAGLSGADLANLLNEAALLAARRQAREITQRDLEDAIEKVVAGPERKSRRLNEEEKHRVAYHEVGHALMAAYTPHADPVHKISIVREGEERLGTPCNCHPKTNSCSPAAHCWTAFVVCSVDVPPRKSYLPRSALAPKTISNAPQHSLVRW